MPPLAAQLIVFGVVVFVLVAFWRQWLAPELAAIAGTGVLLLLGILEPPQVLATFSNSALVTIGAMFVLSAALERTGVIDVLGRCFARLAGDHEGRALFWIIAIPMVLSPFVNNTPIVVVLMPVVLAHCRNAGLMPSKLLAPLSFAAILGGTCSLIGTSTNLLVDGVAREMNQPAFGLFEIAPLGLLCALTGGLYLMTVGRRLLPSRDTVSTLLTPEMRRTYLVQCAVKPGSELIGKGVADISLPNGRGAEVLEVKRHGVRLTTGLDELSLREGDRLLIRAGRQDLGELRKSGHLDLGWSSKVGLEPLEKRESLIVEVILGSNCSFVGKSPREVRFRQEFGAMILAVHRNGVNLRHHLQDLRLAFGDVLLIEGERESIRRLVEEEDFISLTESKMHHPRRRRAPFAIAAIAAFIVFGALGADTLTLALLGAIFVMLTGCVRPEEAYAAIEWRILFLIAGMLGIGEALGDTGGASMLAAGLTQWLAPLGPVALIAALYLLASVLTELISNNAVAILLTPIAIGIAEAAGYDPRGFLVAVMFGASASFATPIGYQTNTYVFGAGGYTLKDFVRVGLPLNILLWIVASVAIPILWKP